MKGLMFIEELYKAVIAEEKTQTRRITQRFKPKEIVFLQEPYAKLSNKVYYKFDMESPFRDSIKWENKMFMKRTDARAFILVESVRSEKLHDISEEDCIKEGIAHKYIPVLKGYRFKDYLAKNSESWLASPIDSYRSLWEKINGKDTWKLNPTVFVIDFKLIHHDQHN